MITDSRAVRHFFINAFAPRARGALLTLAIGGWLSTSPAVAANADSYPDKPINLIVSYPAGGSVDVAARLLQAPLTSALGQQVVVENKGGAGGTIGTALVAKARPDGYTLLITLSSHTITPSRDACDPWRMTAIEPIHLVPANTIADYPGNKVTDLLPWKLAP